MHGSRDYWESKKLMSLTAYPRRLRHSPKLFTIHWSAVWAFVTDPDKVGHCLPDVKEVTVVDPTHFDAVVGVARTQSIEHAPMLVFSIVAVVLVLFMLRT